MKRISFFLAIFILAIGNLIAQVPEKFTYQTVIRNASNQLVSSQTVGVQISILQGGVSGSLVYMETHTANTNTNGLMTLQIGGGNVQQGVFAEIDWASGLYYLKTEIDLTGGNNYSIISTQQLLSVPYALYSQKAGNGFSGDYNDLTNTPALPIVPTNVSAFNNDAGYLTNYIETQTLADVTTLGNSAGNRKLKDVSDPTESYDAVNLHTLTWMMDSLRAEFQQQLQLQQAQMHQVQQQIDSLQSIINNLSPNIPDSNNFVCGTSTVIDHEGNVYNTVQIGEQCWMKENLRTTTSPTTGTSLIPTAGTGSTYTGKQAFWYTPSLPMNYGLLYNWNAAVDTFNTTYGETSVNDNLSNAVSVSFTGHRRGICPEGWHLPSDVEWSTLESIVSGSDLQAYFETTTGFRGSHAGKLAGGDGWGFATTTNGAPGDYSNPDHNASGFSAVPAGLSHYGSSSSISGGSNACFWSSTQGDSSQSYYGSLAYHRNLYYNNAGVDRSSPWKHSCFSVRCLHD